MAMPKATSEQLARRAEKARIVSRRWYQARRTSVLTARAAKRAAAGMAVMPQKAAPFETFCRSQVRRLTAVFDASIATVREKLCSEPRMPISDYTVETRGANHVMGHRRGGKA